MTYLRPEQWQPVGVPSLEPNARAAILTPDNCCVVANPGSGKTEFLAQKATYLLQTNTCRWPRQILAVSFKKEAARNLRDRVAERCGPEQASRLHSLTFDAFAKGLVDRFWRLIPEHWRPSSPYQLVFPTNRDYQESLRNSRTAAGSGAAEIAAISAGSFESLGVGKVRLPVAPQQARSALEFAVFRWFGENLRARPHSTLSFAMINRLAELLLRANEPLLRALRMTYPYVFLDEFQDITYAQYSLLLAAFHTPEARLTAVGDDKQRIMTWAGARVDAFAKFREHFNANAFPLELNFRSSPALVQIQHVVAQAMDSAYVPSRSMVSSSIEGSAAAIWYMDSYEAQASYLAQWIRKDAKALGLIPRDYALLVRQKADLVEVELDPAFASAGLAIRNEARIVGKIAIQDLLAEDVVQVAIALLRIACDRKSPEVWTLARDAYFTLRGVDPGQARSGQVERAFNKLVADTHKRLEKSTPSEDAAAEALDWLIGKLDKAAFARAYPGYAIGEQLDLAIESMREFLRECADPAEGWTECLDAFQGTDSVPLMTIHRSKGLQFHTTFMLQLDDQQWWAYPNDEREGLSSFFVGLSRAKQRVFFTYARNAGRSKLTTPYALLKTAGVGALKID